MLGLFQGPAETGPRALGHRSILANPVQPAHAGNRQPAGEVPRAVPAVGADAHAEAAHRWFELHYGASEANYNAYNYMVLTARPRPDANRHIPAVIHRDNTSRIQIVRRHDPFSHAYLKAMGRQAGVEVSVNTSLNVAGPIVQTPQQALEACAAPGRWMACCCWRGRRCVLAWHAVNAAPKDGGLRLRRWFQQWRKRSMRWRDRHLGVAQATGKSSNAGRPVTWRQWCQSRRAASERAGRHASAMPRSATGPGRSASPFRCAADAASAMSPVGNTSCRPRANSR